MHNGSTFTETHGQMMTIKYAVNMYEIKKESTFREKNTDKLHL